MSTIIYKDNQYVLTCKISSTLSYNIYKLYYNQELVARWTGYEDSHNIFHLIQLDSFRDGYGTVSVNIMKELYNKIVGKSTEEAYGFWEKMGVIFGDKDYEDNDTYYFEII